MLSDQQIKEIATLIKADPTALAEAIKAPEEKAVTIPAGLVVLDEAGLTRVKNDEYASGKSAGVEMAIKDFKEKSGVDFAGKTLDGLAAAITKKALDEAKIEPDKKVQALEADIATLRQTNATLTTQIAEKDGAVSAAQVEREIYKQLPTLGENAIAVEKVIKLMKADGYDFKIEDGKMVPYLNGQPVKDNVANVIPLKDVVTGYAKTEKLITDPAPAPNGRGASDTPPGGVFTKLSELEASYKAQGKSTMGSDFLDHAMKLQKENPDFRMGE